MKYYIPIPKIEISCRRCYKVFMGMLSQKFCSSRCKLQFNEKKFRERAFVTKHQRNIYKILGDTCAKCSREADEIHHKTYHIPVRKISHNKSRKHNEHSLEAVYNMLKEYCKYLMALCFRCHQKIHK